jgi:hypothetical protein
MSLVVRQVYPIQEVCALHQTSTKRALTPCVTKRRDRLTTSD